MSCPSPLFIETLIFPLSYQSSNENDTQTSTMQRRLVGAAYLTFLSKGVCERAIRTAAFLLVDGKEREKGKHCGVTGFMVGCPEL